MWRGVSAGRISGLRAAATFYTLITGIVYGVLLRGLEESLQTPIYWVNEVLHLVIPVVIVIDFLADRTVRRQTARGALAWVIHPILYPGYTLIRGPIAHWYPYPFLDPRENGYRPALLTCLAIAVIAAAGCQLLAQTTRTARPAARQPGSPRSLILTDRDLEIPSLTVCRSAAVPPPSAMARSADPTAAGRASLEGE